MDRFANPFPAAARGMLVLNQSLGSGEKDIVVLIYLNQVN